LESDCLFYSLPLKKRKETERQRAMAMAMASSELVETSSSMVTADAGAVATQKLLMKFKKYKEVDEYIRTCYRTQDLQQAAMLLSDKRRMMKRCVASVTKPNKPVTVMLCYSMVSISWIMKTLYNRVGFHSHVSLMIGSTVVDWVASLADFRCPRDFLPTIICIDIGSLCYPIDSRLIEKV